MHDLRRPIDPVQVSGMRRASCLLVLLPLSLLPRPAAAQDAYHVISVKFNLPADLPKKKWRGTLPNFALIPEFAITKSGWAKIKVLDRDSRWAEQSEPVQVDLRHEGCSGPIHLTVPKEYFDGRGKPVKVRDDEASGVLCRSPGERACGIEVLEAGSRMPVEGVSIADHGLIGKTGADGRWIGARSPTHLTAQLSGERSFDVAGKRRDRVQFCGKDSPDHEVFYVVAAPPQNELETRRSLILFRPGSTERRTADGLESHIEFDDAQSNRGIAAEARDAVSVDERLIFHDGLQEVPARVRLGASLTIPVTLHPGERDLTESVKRQLALGVKRCRIDLLGWAGSSPAPVELQLGLGADSGPGPGPAITAHAFGARLTLSRGKLFIPSWLLGLGRALRVEVRLAQSQSRRELGRIEIAELAQACAGELSSLSWSPPRSSTSWPIRVVEQGPARAPLEDAAVYLSAVRRAADCAPGARDLWAGASDAAGMVSLGEAADQLVEDEGLCACAERRGAIGCAFGRRGKLEELAVPAAKMREK